MSRVEYLILGIDKEENGILIYIPHQMESLIIRAITWENMFTNLHELATSKNINFWYL